MTHNYVLDWQKDDIEKPNILNVLGLFMLNNADPRFFSDHHNPLDCSSARGSSLYNGDIVQASEKVLAKLVNSKYNRTTYNSFHFIVSDSLQTSIELMKPEKNASEPSQLAIDFAINDNIAKPENNASNTLQTIKESLKPGKISMLLMSTPLIRSGIYDSKSMICALNSIIDLNFDGKIIGIIHGWSEKALEREYSKRGIPVVEVDNCYKFHLERAMLSYFNNDSINNSIQSINLKSNHDSSNIQYFG